ncbi:TLD domain-containing protein 2 [Amphibalanus amphitrite]|uniref:Oxidation resistance protein 1 n=1 Tax=Amphibalanus amphitrite TaxID=1232801 RepID=A0A6A4VZ77_AMPAM|nr:TLD domain-containing protein 2 [Amphibalanus amphitrite]KAF0299466.1 TLD domain-containing protein 2 [Amphibalanus amphitrite]
MSVTITELSEPAPALEPVPETEGKEEQKPDAEPEQRRSMKRRISLADVEMYLRPFDWFGSLRAKIKHKKILSRLRPAKKQKKMGGMSDELRRALCSNSMTSMDMEFVPDLIGKSELLTDDIRKKLCKKIPPRVEGHPWSLIFSSSEHGFSLKSLYRKSSAYECPMLLFVQDTDEQIFGALCSTPIHMSEHYYGTGETFLFTFHEGFRTFAWSGENLYFVRGSPDGLEFGSGDGHYGLYLDGDLYRGRTQRCLTYNNDPLTGSTDFIVRAVELWALT